MTHGYEWFDDERICMVGYSCSECGRIRPTGMRWKKGRAFMAAFDKAYGLTSIKEEQK